MKVRELIKLLSKQEWMDADIEVSMEVYSEDNPYLRVFSKEIDICPQYEPGAVLFSSPVPKSIILVCEHGKDNFALEGYELSFKKQKELK